MQGLYREISDQGLFGTDRDCRAKFVSKGRSLYQKGEVCIKRARFVSKDRGPIFLCKYRASEVNTNYKVYYMANISVAPFRIF